MEVVVTGIGLISCLGSLTQSWQKLLRGESGIKISQPFSELPPFPLGLIDKQPSNLAFLTKKIVKAALEDARLKPPLADCGVVVGSSRGCQAEWENLLRNSSDDLTIPNWLNTLPYQASVAAAREIGSTGVVMSPMAACATGIWAIAQGYELIRTGQCERVIAGAVETPITPLSLAGFSKMGALAQTGCYPFDKLREGLVLGEGGAVLVLESADLARRRHASIYGEILGFGLTADAHHISAPNPSCYDAIRAVKNCLVNSNLKPEDINYIHAHGTSTKLNDFHEAELIKYLFPDDVSVSSTKGATGHTLGASGAIGTAFYLMAIRSQKLPPCVGLKVSEFDINLVRKSSETNLDKALCFSFGFGGQNAVLAVGKI